MELDLSCFDKDFDRLNLLVQEQSKHLRKKEKLYESQIYTFLEENREDLLDYAILEQVRRDQWNRQYGFLLSQLGYESVPEEYIKKRIDEGFAEDMLIDLFFAGMPALVRAIGAAGSLASFGISAGVAEGIAKMLAGGGAAYYAYYAYEEYESGNKLNTFFNILNMLFSLEQAAIPFVSDAIAAAGKLFIRFLGTFFSFITGPIKFLAKISGQAAGVGLTAVNKKLGLESLEKVAAFLSKNETVLVKGSEAISSVAAGGAKAATKLEQIIEPILRNETIRSANPNLVTKLEIALAEISGPIMTEASEAAKVIANSIDSASTATKATDVVVKNKAILDLLGEISTLAKSGGILEHMLGSTTKLNLVALEKELLGEAGEMLGKVGAEVVEKQMAKGIVALENAFGKGVADVAADMTTSVTSEFVSAGYMGGASYAPKFIEKAGELMFQFPARMTGPLAGTEVKFAEGMRIMMKQVAEKRGPEAANLYYKTVMEGISSGPVYKEMVEAFGNLAAEGAQSSTVREWVSRNLSRVFVEDFGGLMKTFRAFKSKYTTAMILSGSTSSSAIKLATKAAFDQAKINTTQNFWKILGQLASGSTTAGRKATDPRTSAQKARARAAKAPKVPSTIKTRKAGTAGTPASKIKSSSAGATKTKTTISIDDML
jgi:hypothetical protein